MNMKIVTVSAAVFISVALLIGAQEIPRQQRIRVSFSYAEGVKDPSQIAAQSSLIIEARAAFREAPRSARGALHSSGKTPRRRDVAWSDVRFDEVKVIHKGPGVPIPGGMVVVRVYDADTPEISFKVTGEPQFTLGERYLLCLTETDGFAPRQGLPHWRAVGGTHGVYRLSGVEAVQEFDKLHRARPVSEVLPLLKKGFEDVAAAAHWREIRSKHPRGIDF